MFPDCNRDICSVVRPMESAPMCLISSTNCLTPEVLSPRYPGTLLWRIRLRVSFLIHSISCPALSCDDPANAETIKILLGLSCGHYSMQSVVLIDNSYFLYYDFYSPRLLSAPEI